MKYLFFIMLICAGCRGYWRPKPEKVETTKVDSGLVVDTDSTRLNFVVLNNEKYFFIGVKSDSTVIRRIRDTLMMDSLIEDAKLSKRNLNIYGESAGGYPEFERLFKALKKKEMFRFQLVADDNLKELRIEK